MTRHSRKSISSFVGLVVYHFPIEDGMIPTSVSALNRLLVKIRKRIADGNRVLIHCYGMYY